MAGPGRSGEERRDAAAVAADGGWRRARPDGAGEALDALRRAMGARAGRLGAALSGLLAREAAAFDPMLAAPLALGLGIALYFAAPQEPNLAAGALAVVVTGMAAAALHRRPRLFALALFAAAVMAGLTAATLRTRLVAGPQIVRGLTATATGLVLSVDRRARGGARLVLRPLAIEGLAADALPRAVRLTAARAEDVAAGDVVTLKALLRPPPPPALPGGYDFARDAFFDGIGGVGFVAGAVTKADAAGAALPTGVERFRAALDRARNALTDRIVAAVPGETGAVTASQVTGKRGLIPEDATAALRASGLYHVVSISGLHMSLFAGGLFWAIRAGLALSASLALTRPLKALAALLSLLPAAAYTLFSGAEVATVRSFLMTALVLGAVALGRSAITRRNVALAATLVLLAAPESLMGPSFQMSFGAVAMLVAWYDRPRPPRPRPPDDLLVRWAWQVLRVLAGLVITTLVASLATAPFAAFHFHRLTLQSIAANFLATPIVSALIMPGALLALAAEPFGYGAPFWRLTGVAVGWFMEVARLAASWPGSNLVTPQFPDAALPAFGAALVMLAILRTRLAFVAALPLALGLALAMSAERPAALVGAGGRAALVRDGQGLALIGSKADAFTLQAWLLAMGDARAPDDPTLKAATRCDAEGCAAPLGQGRVLMLDRTMNAVEEDCGRVAILVSPLAIPERCRAGGAVLGREEMAAAGSLALYAGPKEASSTGWRIDAARPAGVSRPWMPAAPAEKPPPVKTRADPPPDAASVDPSDQ